VVKLNVPCYHMPDYKAFIIISLFTLTVYNAFSSTGIVVLYSVLFAMIVAGVVDGVIIKYRKKIWSFPSGALISAMIISMIMAPGNYLLIAEVIIISLALKHILNIHFRNLFNPAALTLVVCTLFLPIFSTWWGSAGVITFIVGFLLCVVIKRLDSALAIFIPFFVIDTIVSYATTAHSHFHLDHLSGPLIYFSFFMAIEPVTTPTTRKGRIYFGVLTAVFALIMKQFPYMVGNSFFLYCALLLSNLLMRIIPRRLLQ